MTQPTLVAAKTWTDDGRKKYDVYLGDELIGYIEQHRPTIERKTKGRMYVNSRWTSKTWHWIWWPKGNYRAYHSYYRVRKDAVEKLVYEHSRKLKVDD